MSTSNVSGTNWSLIVEEVGLATVADFANGAMSGRELTELVTFSEAAGQVRNLLRSKGVSKARALARKAVSIRA